jgi:putative heme-binding domain-containing protein
MSRQRSRIFSIAKKLQLLLAVIVVVLAASGCNNSKEPKTDPATKGDPKLEKLKLLPDFHAEHLYSPGVNEQGSWVAMTFDDKGRMITSDQYGYLYRVTLPPIGSDTATNKIKVEKLAIDIPGDTSSATIKIGYAHALMYAFNSLYVMINDEGDHGNKTRKSGLYRLQDTNGDDQYDKLTLLKRLEGQGEHGPHSIVLSPDKKSIYVIAGNFTKMPEMNTYTSHPVYKHDNVLALVKDPNGHDNVVNIHGGWIAHIDSTGSNWELISSGFRNPFDLAFNEDGEIFTYDSDMEWDFGLPWYRPTRICHVTSGSEFGWRPGTNKWSPAYPDNLPAVLNIGQGSPTSVFSGIDSRFPEKYRRSIFAFDWSFGIIYALHPKAEGSSYKTTAEEFISGAPLPLTDGLIGPDGALYFLTGGRRLESDLYRVYYKDNKEPNGALVSSSSDEATKARKTRMALEVYHGKPNAAAVAFAWPFLKDPDRFIRFAARVAVENQPPAQWQEKALAEKDPQILTQALLALSRTGDSSSKINNKIFDALIAVDFKKLPASQKIDFLRVFDVTLYRMGLPDASVTARVNAYLNQFYPSSSNDVDRMLCKILVYTGDAQVVQKTLVLMDNAKDEKDTLQATFTNSNDLVMRNPQYGMDIAKMLSNKPPQQQVYLGTALSKAASGWTPALRDKYFKWFINAFSYKGGVSYIGFIDGARKLALANLPKDQLAHYNSISGQSLLDSANNNRLAINGPKPKGPGRRWQIDSALFVVQHDSTTRDLADGKAMFDATLCSSCHTMNGVGGAVGPDLSQLGTRFSAHDILESIIEPSKVISDQYAATNFYMKDGSSIIARLKNEDASKYYVIQNPFTPQTVREIPKSDVSKTSVSDAPSIMYPGLINSLNPEELKNLMAYLISGGNKDNPVYKPRSK